MQGGVEVLQHLVGGGLSDHALREDGDLVPEAKKKIDDPSNVTFTLICKKAFYIWSL